MEKNTNSNEFNRTRDETSSSKAEHGGDINKVGAPEKSDMSLDDDLDLEDEAL